MRPASTALSNGKRTVTPYIAVHGGAAAFIDFLVAAFEAREFGRFEQPDGTIGHAEVAVGDSTLMLFDARPEWPRTPSLLSVYVDDVDDVYAAAVAAGATPLTELMDFELIGDRAGRVVDPFGNLWWLQTHVRDVSPEELPAMLADGDLMSRMVRAQADAERYFAGEVGLLD